VHGNLADEITTTKYKYSKAGYDVVAFFKEGKPVKGEKTFTVNWSVFQNNRDVIISLTQSIIQ
jgi:hypothetical protein